MEEHLLRVAECSVDFHPDFRGFRASEGHVLVFFRVGAVKTLEHLNIAYYVSRRIREQTRYRDEGVIMMLLLSGMHQIKDAIEHIGLREGDTEFMVAYSNVEDFERFIGDFNVSVRNKNPVMKDRDTKEDESFFPSMVSVILSIT